LPHQGRELVTKRLAAPRGQHGQTILAGEQSLHHRALPWPKFWPTEMAAKGLLESRLYGSRWGDFAS
jgi:hypothetical protein